MNERQLAYTSRRVSGIHDDEVVDEIVLPSILRNRSVGITGCLWFDEDRFFQVIEGPEHEVAALYKKILVDDRHCEVTLLINEPIVMRDFPRFSLRVVRQMGSRRVAAFDALKAYLVDFDRKDVSEQLTRAAYAAVEALAQRPSGYGQGDRADAERSS